MTSSMLDTYSSVNPSTYTPVLVSSLICSSSSWSDRSYARATTSRNSGGNGKDSTRTNHETLLRRLQQIGNLFVVDLTQHKHNRQKGSAQGDKRSLFQLQYHVAHPLAVSICTWRSVPPERSSGIDTAAASPRCFSLPV